MQHFPKVNGWCPVAKLGISPRPTPHARAQQSYFFFAARLRAVLRAGAFELMFKDNVPAKVAINEYVNVASAFFDKEEPALANAVLNALARARRPQEFQT